MEILFCFTFLISERYFFSLFVGSNIDKMDYSKLKKITRFKQF